MTPILAVTRLTKRYLTPRDASGGGVQDIEFSVPPGEFFTILGPSGCGKTTLLRCIAGLEFPDAGQIAIAGQDVFDAARKLALPANRRSIGMVFQSYAIWPHMTVLDNVAFPLTTRRAGRVDRAQRRQRVEHVLATVGLEGLSGRPATALSGGQQQRLALARAMVDAPKLLLLDEPLSNLDAGLRERMRIELRRLQQEAGVATVYVTHDQSEALALSDRVAVMRAGRIVQLATPGDIYHRPASEFVARFIGANNIVAGRVTGASTVDTPLGVLQCQLDGRPTGSMVQVMIRPEHWDVTPGEINVLHGILRSVSFLGELVEYHIMTSSGDMLLRRGAPVAEWAVAMPVRLSVRSEHVVLLTK